MSISKLVVLAPAKINIHLVVGERKGNGLHEIFSLFQKISLYDIVFIEVMKDNPRIQFSCSIQELESENIVLKAVRKYLEGRKSGEGLRIRLLKGIPVGAGLGGGSSDAAAVLHAMSIMLGDNNKNSEKELKRMREIALEVGSDVTFFLDGYAASVTGTGEIVREIEARGDYWVIVVYPGFGISTAAAYGWLDRSRQKGGMKKKSSFGKEIVEKEIVNKYNNLNPDKWDFSNSFEEVVLSRYPVIARLKKDLKESGAQFSMLSGSGSSVFGVFGEKKVASGAFSYLKKNYKFVKLCKPLAGATGSILELN